MKAVVRWMIAALVTIAAFAVIAWICGAVVLVPFLRDPGVRWGVAGALGVAVAALAALWGHSFATAEGASEPVSGNDGREAVPGPGSGDTDNTISGGVFHGPVIQGRDISISGLASGQPVSPRDRGPEGQG
jgi:hypothetical protein